MREPFWWPMNEPPLPGEFEEGTPHVLKVIDQARAGIRIALGVFHEQLEMKDREPQPSDGPDYHTEHSYWEARQEPEDE